MSEQQRKYLYSQKPEAAKKFAAHSGKQGKALPSRVAQPINGKARNNA